MQLATLSLRGGQDTSLSGAVPPPTRRGERIDVLTDLVLHEGFTVSWDFDGYPVDSG